MLKRYIDNEKGMALATVLMVMVVLSILGTALMSVALAENNFSGRQQRKLQAHYIAKSGLEAVAKNFLKNPIQLKNALAASTVYTGVLQSGAPGYTVELSGTMGGIVTLKSTAVVENVKDEVSLEVNTGFGPSGLFENSIFCLNNLNVSGMNVTGPLQSGGTVTAPAGYAFPVTQNSPVYVQLEPFPIGYPLTVSKTIVNGETLEVSVDTEFGDLTINNGGKLKIITNSNIVEIVVNNLDVNGIIEITGSGSVILSIKNNMTMRTSGSVNYGIGTDPSKLLVIMADNSLFYIQAGIGFGGYILGPQASVYVDSGNITFKGAIVCKDFTQNNNATMNFVPVTTGPASNLDGLAFQVAKKLYKN